MKLRTLALIILPTLLFTNCTSDDETPTNACDKSVIISAEQFENAPDDQLTINNVEIEGDCLKINYSSSGCSGGSWELELIDANVILESEPPQRNLRLSLKNEESCEAYITRDISFNLSDIKTETFPVYLNLKDFDDQIFYE